MISKTNNNRLDNEQPIREEYIKASLKGTASIPKIIQNFFARRSSRIHNEGCVLDKNVKSSKITLRYTCEEREQISDISKENPRNIPVLAGKVPVLVFLSETGKKYYDSSNIDVCSIISAQNKTALGDRFIMSSPSKNKSPLDSLIVFCSDLFFSDLKILFMGKYATIQRTLKLDAFLKKQNSLNTWVLSKIFRELEYHNNNLRLRYNVTEFNIVNRHKWSYLLTSLPANNEDASKLPHGFASDNSVYEWIEATVPSRQNGSIRNVHRPGTPSDAILDKIDPLTTVKRSIRRIVKDMQDSIKGFVRKQRNFEIEEEGIEIRKNEKGVYLFRVKTQKGSPFTDWDNSGTTMFTDKQWRFLREIYIKFKVVYMSRSKCKDESLSDVLLDNLFKSRIGLRRIKTSAMQRV